MDWKLCIFALQSLTLLVSIAGFIMLKANDLRHLKMNIDEFKNSVQNRHEENQERLDKLEDRLIKIGEHLAKQEGICNARHNK